MVQFQDLTFRYARAWRKIRESNCTNYTRTSIFRRHAGENSRCSNAAGPLAGRHGQQHADRADRRAAALGPGAGCQKFHVRSTPHLLR